MAAAVLAAQWPLLHAQGMALDDTLFLTQNPLVLHPGWESVRRFFVEVLEPSTVSAYYLPLSMTSLMADVALGAHPGHLEPLHVTNLVLHAANTILVLLVLRRMFGRLGPALLAALLFGLHPLAVEPVASIGERKTLLATLFAFGSVLAWLQVAASRAPLARALPLGLFALALLSKPSVTTLPLLLLVLDGWPLRRWSWRSLLEKWPYLALSALFAAITLLSVARTWELPAPPPVDPARMALQVAWLLGFYLRQVAWPANLSCVYPPPATWSLADPAVAFGVAVTLALLASLAIHIRRPGPWFTGGAFFLLALVPTFGILRWSAVIAYDRYVYFPGLGLAIVACAGLVRLADSPLGRDRAGRALLVALAVLTLAGETLATRRTLAPWRDSLTLWRHIVARAPRTPDSHNGLGVVHLNRHEPDLAIAEFRAAIAADGGYMDAHTNLGAALTDAGRAEEALPHLRFACERQPRSPNSAWLLGVALKAAGRLPDSEAELRRALSIRPSFVRAQVQLGLVEMMQGKADSGLATLREAVARAPQDAYARIGLATGLLGGGGGDDEVFATLRAAVRLDPDSPTALNALAWLLATSPDPARRDPAEALRLADRAVERTDRRDADALDTRGAALAASGRFDVAIESGLAAASLAEQRGEPALAAQIRTRVEGYRRGVAWIEDRAAHPPAPTAGAK